MLFYISTVLYVIRKKIRNAFFRLKRLAYQKLCFLDCIFNKIFIAIIKINDMVMSFLQKLKKKIKLEQII